MSKHTCCTNFQISTEVSELVAFLFLKSRSAVLDCGCTPGPHAYTHSHFICLSGLMAAGPLLHTHAGDHASLCMVCLSVPQLENRSVIILGIKICTVAILAQGTNWAVADTQALFYEGQVLVLADCQAGPVWRLGNSACIFAAVCAYLLLTFRCGC